MRVRTVQFDELYREHAPALLRYLAGRFSRHASAEDLLQETFLQAVKSAGRTPGRSGDSDGAPLPHSTRAWLFGIARHVGLTALRRSEVRRSVELPQGDVLAAPADESDARMDAMRAAIARLPDAMRETLELRLKHDLSYEEIAGVLDVPVGTVRSRLHHAVGQLREMLIDQD